MLSVQYATIDKVHRGARDTVGGLQRRRAMRSGKVRGVHLYYTPIMRGKRGAMMEWSSGGRYEFCDLAADGVRALPGRAAVTSASRHRA